MTAIQSTLGEKTEHKNLLSELKLNLPFISEGKAHTIIIAQLLLFINTIKRCFRALTVIATVVSVSYFYCLIFLLFATVIATCLVTVDSFVFSADNLLRLMLTF